MNIKKFAAIDIGSNAMRVLISNIIETEQGVHFQKNALVRAPIRLGEDSFTLGEISKKSLKRMVNAMKAFMVLGDLMTKEGDELSDEAVKYKERIAFATMRASIPDWQPPSDWNSLTNKQKLDRLNKLKSV